MREPEMFNPIIRYLEQQNYRILQVNKGNKPGPDILAEKVGRKLLIQMKGDSEAIKTDWDTALGQLLDMMTDENVDYAVAVSESYEKHVKNLPAYARNRLQLIFFVVKNDGTVRRV